MTGRTAQPGASPARDTFAVAQPKAAARAAATPAREVTLAGRSIAYRIRVSPRARSIRLVIRPATGLEVVLPRGAGHTRAEQVIQEKAGWILRTLDRIASEPVQGAEPPVSGSALAFAGRRLTLALATGAPAGRFRATLDGDTLRLTTADAAQETVRAALDAWYRRQARVVIAERLTHWNAHYSFTYGRVTIKEQKSRWGSCSRQGNLNFNWRLLLAPAPILDYVVIHELAHLKELNHSPRFWAVVAQTCPDYASKRKWLRQHGRDLRF